MRQVWVRQKVGDEIDKQSRGYTKNEWIKIQFFGSDKNHYVVEANLLLLSPDDSQIGYYCYHEDENGEYLDEYLVFE